MLARAYVIAVIAGAIALPAVSAADDPPFVVIVNAKNPVTKIDKKTVADAFLKKITRWSDDTAILPVDQSKSASVRARFTQDVLDRSVAAINRYWSQMLFSGRGVPPPELDSDAAVIKYVTNHASAIGYVAGSADVKGTKVVQIR
jgi:ABC-type phosphate transport system substrate-binding protein